MTRGEKRLVYSSDRGRICGKCGWPVSDCHCSSNLAAPEAPIPARISAKLSIEKRGSGSVVTVVGGLPANRGFLDALARELKKSCGAGGRAGETTVEIQGDHRERLREMLARKGWKVSG